MEKTIIVHRDNHTYLLSRADWERITYVSIDKKQIPAMKMIRDNSIELHLDSTVDLADVDINYYVEQCSVYRNYIRTEKKEKTIVRKIQSQWIFWKNRKSYGGICLYVRLKNDVTVLLNEGWKNIKPQQFAAEELPANKDGSLKVINLDNWKPQNYAAEFKRISGLDVLIGDLIADQPVENKEPNAKQPKPQPQLAKV